MSTSGGNHFPGKLNISKLQSTISLIVGLKNNNVEPMMLLLPLLIVSILTENEPGFLGVRGITMALNPEANSPAPAAAAVFTTPDLLVTID